jgi:hypothetical protein
MCLHLKICLVMTLGSELQCQVFSDEWEFFKSKRRAYLLEDELISICYFVFLQFCSVLSFVEVLVSR